MKAADVIRAVAIRVNLDNFKTAARRYAPSQLEQVLEPVPKGGFLDPLTETVYFCYQNIEDAEDAYNGISTVFGEARLEETPVYIWKGHSDGLAYIMKSLEMEKVEGAVQLMFSGGER